MNNSKLKILVVDDDPNVNRMISLFLRSQPFEVESVNSARIGLHKLQNDSFQVIITDLQMPEISGIEFIRQIRARGIDIPVIVSSAYGIDDTADEAIQSGATKILRKPFDSKILINAINEVVR